MIQRSTVVPVGHFYKTHGVNGELALSYTSTLVEEVEADCWVVDMDGILVPFFPVSFRLRGKEAALVCFDGVTTETEAKALVGKEVYFSKKYLEEVSEEDLGWDTLIGFTVMDESAGELGTVQGIDDSTLNALLVVSDGEKETLIPLAGDFLVGIDVAASQVFVSLPEALLDL